MKVDRALLAAFALMLTTCSGAPPMRAPCEGSSCARGSTVGAFEGLAPASYAEAPPLSLTAPDGTALTLESLDAETVVDEPLAYTQLAITFVNPEPRMIEGRFRIALPMRASVSRFAMKIAGSWQEGEVVERERATEVYEDFLHKQVDPALLEQGAGNELTARVYPIAPRSKVELVVGYSQELVGDIEELAPLEGLTPTERLHVRVSDAASKKVTFASHASSTSAIDSLSSGSRGLRSDELMVARVRPSFQTQPDPLGSALLLVDTSASRAFDLEREVALVSSLVKAVAAVSPEAPIVVAAFDQRSELVFAGAARDFRSQHGERILRRRALGASDLASALGWAGRAARARRIDRVVLVSDGVPTAGAVEPSVLAVRAQELVEMGVARLDAVGFGGIRDGELLSTLVAAGLERDGAVIDGELRHEVVWRKLNSATRSGVELEMSGADWWWPRRLEGVQPGDEVLVYAELDPSATPELSVDGLAVALPELRSTERPLLERAVARAKIAGLVEREHREGSSDELRAAIVALATRHRLLSPYTSLLVLEQEWHYQRFGIDRRALSDILVVRDGRIDVLERSLLVDASSPRDDSGASEPRPVSAVTAAGPPPAPSPQAAGGAMWGDAIGESFAAGGFGLSGVGEGGGGEAAPRATGSGRGRGQLSRRHRAVRPRIRMARVSVSGRLPPEVIQRIVRQNFGRFRGAYEKALRRDPSLRGRMSVRFVIDREGQVGGVALSETDIADSEMQKEVLEAFRMLTFPRPEGGIITVVYPIVFSADGSATQPQPTGLRANAVARRPPPPPATKPARDEPPEARPHTGDFHSILQAIAAGRPRSALEEAASWQARAPGDALALVALGEALEAAGERAWAARAYGSIVDLFPTRADLRRFAGGYLEHVGAIDLAIDSYEKARRDRPDHPSSHRLYAYALLKKKRYREAFEVLQGALDRRYRSGRFLGAEEVLRQDLGLVAAAWLAADPSRRAEVTSALELASARLATEPSLRFVLTWETDTNDVDLHIFDETGHASFEHPRLPSGGSLHADVTNGFGPEMFSLPGPRKERSSHRLFVHYYERGPMGYGMGKVALVEHDGKGGLSFDERPFVVMVDRAYVDLGTTR